MSAFEGLSLSEVASLIVANGHGILAADESTGTMGKRLGGVDMQNTYDNRMSYRSVILGDPSTAAPYIGGVILYEETLQSSIDGVPVPQLLADAGIVPGIKVDLGLSPLWDNVSDTDQEKVTMGQDNLPQRLADYYKLGARFSKWRALFRCVPEKGLPSDRAIREGALRLARYAQMSQAAGIVPIVEPEVLLEGGRTLDEAADINRRVWSRVFLELNAARVDMSGMLLKPSFVLPGLWGEGEVDPEAVASATLSTLASVVPPAVPGIVFLSGGLTCPQATEYLQAINVLNNDTRQVPYKLSFSYGRALQAPVLSSWAEGDKEMARQEFLTLARDNSLACQ
ncbi:fructose-bisphosphate aldolase, class-I, partial [Kipferlia bialata]|eukprot:g7714.t1